MFQGITWRYKFFPFIFYLHLKNFRAYYPFNTQRHFKAIHMGQKRKKKKPDEHSSLKNDRSYEVFLIIFSDLTPKTFFISRCDWMTFFTIAFTSFTSVVQISCVCCSTSIFSFGINPSRSFLVDRTSAIQKQRINNCTKMCRHKYMIQVLMSLQDLKIVPAFSILMLFSNY